MSKSNILTFGQRVWLEILWFLCRVVSILPHWFRYYLLADFIYFLIYHCFNYRIKVVDKNLRNSFPDLSDAERKKIRKGFYHYLSEVVISTLSLASKNSKRSIIHRDKSGSYGPIEQCKVDTSGKSWVALTAHYGLWEYLIFWADFADQSMVAVYHPLESAVFDILFQRLRSHKNVNPVAAKETIRFCLEHQDGIDGKNYVIGLIADQNPPRRPNSHWFSFMNQESIFFDGGEKIALKFKLPVYFVYQRRLKRGVYEYNYELIHDGVESVEPYEITRRYVDKLERVIQADPHLWLWSHRRWKHNPNKCKQPRP